jgi:hypothetical protein
LLRYTKIKILTFYESIKSLLGIIFNIIFNESTQVRKLDNNWKQVAWNGIRFKTPAGWEVGQIGTRHLMLEDEKGPVMEVKWGYVKGAFSHKTQLKRLISLRSRRTKVNINEWFLPARWKDTLADFETSGFLWQGRDASGRGAILFCPVCRTAALIQFFRDSSVERENILMAVLKSYRDHAKGGRVLWSIFDIRAILPNTLHLLRFRFDVGKFELVFSANGQTIHLHRWAPAAALLGERDLISFTKTIPEFAEGHPHSLTFGDCKAVEWSRASDNGWRQKMSRFKVKPSFFWFRLWHLEEQNRILSVRSESKYPLDFELLNQICADYESI